MARLIFAFTVALFFFYLLRAAESDHGRGRRDGRVAVVVHAAVRQSVASTEGAAAEMGREREARGEIGKAAKEAAAANNPGGAALREKAFHGAPGPRRRPHRALLVSSSTATSHTFAHHRPHGTGTGSSSSCCCCYVTAQAPRRTLRRGLCSFAWTPLSPGGERAWRRRHARGNAGGHRCCCFGSGARGLGQGLSPVARLAPSATVRCITVSDARDWFALPSRE